jgi:uncharacterized protein YdhG (YjbR/CyaY superfamily)
MTASDIERIEDYLGKLAPDQRQALEHIRALVKETAPEAEEALVYGVPGFRKDGALVCYAGFKSHCGFYPMSPATLEAFAAELAAFETAKGTVRFTPDHPVPDATLAAIVRHRLAENAETVTARKANRKKKD